MIMHSLVSKQTVNLVALMGIPLDANSSFLRGAALAPAAIRRALGARQRHIAVQFLVETVVLSTTGGVVGVLLGVLGAWMITHLADWETIVSGWSVIVSFSLSVLVGIFFGMYPALSAAKLDPIEALRYE